jgi:HD superfamily phosphohydrolase
LLSEIISSSLDADKLDYLRRDSYHTGVAYGIFDLERVVRTVCKIRESGRDYVAIEEKGREALESYRLARYSMHTQVYEHHTRLIADDMFVKAVIASINDGQFPREYFDLRNPEEFLPRYSELDDNSIEHYILQNANGISKELIAQVRARKLLKRAYVLPLTREAIPNPIQREKLITMTKDDVQKVEEEIASKSKVDRKRLIVHLQSISIRLYERFEQSLGRKEKPILIKKRDGTLSSLDEESPISASMTPIRRLFVFCPGKNVDKVKQIVEKVFQAQSIF